jgi:hypothetical protein
MIRYSHVSLFIPCALADATQITAQLGVNPSEVKEWTIQSWEPSGTMKEEAQHTWTLHSPMTSDQGVPTARIWSLVEVIRPFAKRLVALDERWNRWIDIVYHVTPQRAGGITGEFDYFSVPATMMKLLGSWNLGVSYESFWFDHPDWQTPPRSWWRRAPPR